MEEKSIAPECDAARDEPGFDIGGYFMYRVLDADGTPLTDWEIAKNGVNNTALNDVLNVYLNSGTQKTTWYIGLIDNAGFSALSQSDTISSHTGWNENTAYSQAARQTCTFAAAASQSITNSANVASFTINSNNQNIYGAFLVSDSTKGGTVGLLFATGAFAAVQALSNGQVLQVTYTCSAASN
jgi:hypothetical protein